jgi:sulfite reductase (NADPH) flavoprotein alpha-component
MGGREMGYMGPGLPGQRSSESAEDRAFTEALWRLPPGRLRTEYASGAVAMFQDMRAGRIKACWIICSNPVASMPNRSEVIAALQAAELVITQDAFLDTETNMYADIMLPGALWAEAEGVMVNSERNMTLTGKAVEPPGDALPDWQIIARVACAMGYAEAFSFASADAVFDELKQAANPATGYDIGGASHARLRAQPLQWPIPAHASAHRNPIRYLGDSDGGVVTFPTPSGRARFLATPHTPPAEMPDAAYPFTLNTGRLQHQWHTLTKTGKIPTLNKLNPAPFIEINPQDAAELGIAAQDRVEIRSRRGVAILPATVADRVRPGNCFAPFHWNDLFGDDLAINAVTSDAADPISFQPDFKACTVFLARLSGPASASQGNVGGQAHPEAGSPPAPGKPDEMTRIEALAKLLGLDAAPAIPLDADEKIYMQGFLSGLAADTARAPGAVPLLPPGAPILPHTRLWLDGVLAGLFSRVTLPAGSMPASGVPPAEPVMVLWASQIGKAEAFASVCARHLEGLGHPVRLVGMDRVQPAELAAVPVVLLLASTFGDGDPPDSAVAFWSALQSEAMARLENTRFAVLAFGDSSYDTFCGFGRNLDARLEALGARRLTARVDCEPDYEEPARLWLEHVVQALQGAAQPAQADRVAASAMAAPAPPLLSPAPNFGRARPLLTRLVGNRLLNAAGAEKETRQFIFDLAGTAFTYEVGDALGVWPKNDPGLVADMLATLDLPEATAVSVPGHGTMPLGAALLSHYEIGKTTPDMLRLVAERSRSTFLIDLMLEERKTERADWLWGRQFIDLLHGFPIRIAAAELLSALKPMQPRLYSISSSPAVHPAEVHLTVSTVRYAVDGAARGGVCSTFLADRAEGTDVPIFVQKTTHFRPPRDPARPMIMVGPGTGVAPFRAFLQERQASGAKGKNWLFFGEQRAKTDFYYRDELETMRRQGGLHRLDTAFSRDQAEKIYVQHRMIENGALLWRWLQDGAHFYVCGDATRMAKDVDAALRMVAERNGKMSAEKAAEYVATMSSEKRYVRDVY